MPSHGRFNEHQRVGHRRIPLLWPLIRCWELGCRHDEVADAGASAAEAPWTLSRTRQNDFPVLYGAVPHDMAERVTAKPPTAGATFRIEGWDGDGCSRACRRSVHERLTVREVAVHGSPSDAGAVRDRIMAEVGRASGEQRD